MEYTSDFYFGDCIRMIQLVLPKTQLWNFQTSWDIFSVRSYKGKFSIRTGDVFQLSIVFTSQKLFARKNLSLSQSIYFQIRNF